MRIEDARGDGDVLFLTPEGRPPSPLLASPFKPLATRTKPLAKVGLRALLSVTTRPNALTLAPHLTSDAEELTSPLASPLHPLPAIRLGIYSVFSLCKAADWWIFARQFE